MKILLSVYACEPNRGSECEIGWNWALHTARMHQTWVITRTGNRATIEAALAGVSNPQFVYVDLPLRFWKKLPGGLRLYYYLWQVLAWWRARGLHQRVGFDMVHHVTWGIYWLPSFMALLPAPLIWGPVGGGESAPAAFRSTFPLRGRLYEWARDLAQAVARLDPFLRLTARRSVLALATTEETADRLRALGCRNVRVMSQVGVTFEDLPAASKSAHPVRVCSAGRLLHWKGFDLALRAMARVPDVEYWIFGDGPERRRLERLARELGIQQRVRFRGNIPRPQLLRELADCDLMVHPSLHESGGFVCMEAMALGCPVVCLDRGGPALQVSSDTGIKVPAQSPPQAVRDLTSAVALLAGDPAMRRRMAAAARERVRHLFTWDRKVEALYAGLGADSSREFAERSA